MKKLLCVLLLLTLIPASGMADDTLLNSAIANAVVSAAEYVDVVAPFSGTLCPFELTMGDRVQAGNTLMSMQTTPLYATEDGTIGAIFAAVGDDASAISQRYGGIMGIEPENLLQLQCSTQNAYNDTDNKTLHLGETLYFRSAQNNRIEGTGRVVAVNGKNYVVDILSGDFDLDESMNLYRDDGYQYSDCVGRGTVARRNDALIPAAGRVAALHVAEGQQVKAGQLVAEVVSADAAPGASPIVPAPAQGVVSSIQVAPGQQVWKGQVLCRIELDASLEVVADVDEMDLGRLQVGDRLSVTIDTDEDHIIQGTVTKISALGITKQNAAYYTIRVSIPAGTAPLGASASVYLPKE